MNTIEELRNNNKVLNHLQLIKSKESYQPELNEQKIGMIELHLTDKCDLNCIYCSYGANIKSPSREYCDFPFQGLEHIVKAKPKAIVLAGGGEPTLYNESHRDINDVIRYLKEHEISVGLITNGAKLVDCDLLGEDDWIRVSLDADTAVTFNQLKNGDFDKRIETIISYAKSSCKVVGIGYLYNRFSLDKIPHFIKSMYDMALEDLGGEYLNKINLQFRPTCPVDSCDCPSMNYEGRLLLTPDKYLWWEETKEAIHDEVDRLCEDSCFSDFVREQTNFYQIFEKQERDYDFEHCYMSLSKWLIKTSGDIYPCVMKATNDSLRIGNILTDSFEAIYENELNYYNLKDSYCKGVSECCRISGVVNQIVKDNYDFIPDDVTYDNSYFF